jgi:hypothetical protein
MQFLFNTFWKDLFIFHLVYNFLTFIKKVKTFFENQGFDWLSNNIFQYSFILDFLINPMLKSTARYLLNSRTTHSKYCIWLVQK